MKTLNNKKCLFVIATYFVLSLFVGYILPDNFITPTNYVYIELASDLLIAFAIFLIVKDELKGELNIFKAELKDNLKKALKLTIKMWLIVEIITVIAGVIFIMISGLEAMNNTNSETVIYLLNSNALITCFIAIVVGPFTEEILFRGAIFKLFSKINEEIAVIATSLIFAMLHFATDIIGGTLSANMIPSLVAYLALSYIITNYYYHHRNIVTSMIIHCLYNTINILLMLIFL